MAFTILDNLKGFVTSRPPLIIFMICLASFAVVLVMFAYIVQVNDIPKNDISENWNTFLDSFSKIDFCVKSNLSDYAIESPTTQRLVKEALSQTVTTSTLQPDPLVNVSVAMIVVLTPTAEFLNIPRNITHISTTLTGEQLGLEGAAAELDLNMTFMLSNHWNTSHCDLKGWCKPLKITTCISFQAPLSVFPRTRMPTTCQAVNDSGSEYHLKVVGNTEPGFMWCHDKPVFHVEHYKDPDLAVMLSMHDKSVINLHLLHTSYFLFMMVITLFCYAIVKGRPTKSKLTQYIPAEKVQMTA
ncbi:transmembrane protein 248-like [Gigantopelta aegis]|uniref:transmembrane protein 248-like n=1 Tax=Gigantopelta aegis TaxID=1735272 RepID=UPI001B888637|nr:transmembrane protein 248-like [Gigantopelta aegis]